MPLLAARLVAAKARLQPPLAHSLHRLAPPGDVLDQLLAHILENVRELVADLVAHDPGDADPARFGQRLQPRRNVDAIAVDVVIW